MAADPWTNPNVDRRRSSFCSYFSSGNMDLWQLDSARVDADLYTRDPMLESYSSSWPAVRSIDCASFLQRGVSKKVLEHGVDDLDCRLHISNIPFKFKDYDLIRLFGRFGTVTSVEVIYNDKGSKGFGFISMSTPEEANFAKKAIHKSWIDGRQVDVNQATKKVMLKPTIKLSNIPRPNGSTLIYRHNSYGLQSEKEADVPEISQVSKSPAFTRAFGERHNESPVSDSPSAARSDNPRSSSAGGVSSSNTSPTPADIGVRRASQSDGNSHPPTSFTHYIDDQVRSKDYIFRGLAACGQTNGRVLPVDGIVAKGSTSFPKTDGNFRNDIDFPKGIADSFFKNRSSFPPTRGISEFGNQFDASNNSFDAPISNGPINDVPQIDGVVANEATCFPKYINHFLDNIDLLKDIAAMSLKENVNLQSQNPIDDSSYNLSAKEKYQGSHSCAYPIAEVFPFDFPMTKQAVSFPKQRECLSKDGNNSQEPAATSSKNSMALPSPMKNSSLLGFDFYQGLFVDCLGNSSNDLLSDFDLSEQPLNRQQEITMRQGQRAQLMKRLDRTGYLVEDNSRLMPHGVVDSELNGSLMINPKRAIKGRQLTS